MVWIDGFDGLSSFDPIRIAAGGSGGSGSRDHECHPVGRSGQGRHLLSQERVELRSRLTRLSCLTSRYQELQSK